MKEISQGKNKTQYNMYVVFIDLAQTIELLLTDGIT